MKVLPGMTHSVDYKLRAGTIKKRMMKVTTKAEKKTVQLSDGCLVVFHFQKVSDKNSCNM